MGGGGSKGPSIPDVAPSSITDISSEAVSANIANLPKLLQAYQQYGPQYAQSINDIFSQSQKRLRELYPEQFNVLEPLSQNISANLNFVGDAAQTGGLPENLRASYANQIRGAQAARGVALSPISAVSEANYLSPLAEQFRQNVTGEALDFLGTPPLMAPGSLQSLDTLGLSPIPTSQLFEGGITQDAARVNNVYEQFSLQQEAYNRKREQQKQFGQMVGAVGGGTLGALTGNPTVAMAGANFGSQVGGTFF